MLRKDLKIKILLKLLVSNSNLADRFRYKQTDFVKTKLYKKKASLKTTFSIIYVLFNL